MQKVLHPIDSESIQKIQAEENEFGPFQDREQVSGSSEYTVQVELKEKFGTCHIGWDFPLPITGHLDVPEESGVAVILYKGEPDESSEIWVARVNQPSGLYDTEKDWGSGFTAAIVQKDIWDQKVILASTPPSGQSHYGLRE